MSIGAVDGGAVGASGNRPPVDGSGDSWVGAARKAHCGKGIAQACDSGGRRAQPLDNARKAARSAAELDSRPAGAVQLSWGANGLHGPPGGDSGDPGASGLGALSQAAKPVPPGVSFGLARHAESPTVGCPRFTQLSKLLTGASRRLTYGATPSRLRRTGESAQTCLRGRAELPTRTRRHAYANRAQTLAGKREIASPYNTHIALRIQTQNPDSESFIKRLFGIES